MLRVAIVDMDREGERERHEVAKWQEKTKETVTFSHRIINNVGTSLGRGGGGRYSVREAL